jgi:hypothetical protein
MVCLPRALERFVREALITMLLCSQSPSAWHQSSNKNVSDPRFPFVWPYFSRTQIGVFDVEEVSDLHPTGYMMVDVCLPCAELAASNELAASGGGHAYGCRPFAKSGNVNSAQPQQTRRAHKHKHEAPQQEH